MDKIETLDLNEYYIVSLDNGIRKEEPVTIDILNNFSDGSKLVQLNKTVFGVYKNYSINPDTMYIDDFDIIKADIAELIDINHEECKRIVNEDGNVGIFTRLNYSKDIETRTSATTIVNHIIEYINNGIINNENSLLISETLRLPHTHKGNIITDEKQIGNIIDLGILALIMDIEAKSGQQMPEKSKSSLIKSYIRMILFDFLINRKYRGFDYYLISSIDTNGQPIWQTSYLGPISVSNSTDKDQLIGDNEYLINNRIVDRNIMLKVLFDKYFNEIKKVTTSLNDAKKLYIDAISRIIYNNTDIENAKKLETIILNNLATISSHQAEKEIEIEKDYKINKVERTMATQSLNVRVTAKLDLIQKKYPINPKDHRDILNEEPPKKDKINLIVEHEKNSKAGFANAAILVSTVAFVCGIASGIAYVLMTFGN